MYNLKSVFDLPKSSACSALVFGAPRNAFEKVFNPSNKTSGAGRQTPGPGAYNTIAEPGRDARKFTLKSKVAFGGKIVFCLTNQTLSHKIFGRRLLVPGLTTPK